MNAQRNKKDHLSQEQKDKLNSIQFPWEKTGTDSWLKKYEVLKKAVNNNSTKQYPARLKVWIETQRAHRQQGKLTEEHVALLDAIGFDWQPSANCQLQRTISKPSSTLNSNGRVLHQFSLDESWSPRQGEEVVVTLSDGESYLGMSCVQCGTLFCEFP
jgi:hypothetical protein